MRSHGFFTTDNDEGFSTAPPTIMSCLAWNCQGLRGPGTVRELENLIRALNPSLVFLSETKCPVPFIEKMKRKFFMFRVGVNSVGKSGGIALLWTKELDVSVQRVYGESDASRRKTFWKLLQSLSDKSNLPWLCIRDFNEILYDSEKEGFRQKARATFGNLRKEIADCESRLKEIRKRVLTNRQKTEEEQIKQKLESLREDKEHLWKQRGWMEWLREGDRNTKFFHARASSRCKKNEISRLKGEDGVFVKKKEDIQNIITAYFSNLFKSTKPHKESIEEVFWHVQPKVTTLMNQTLMQPFIAEEVTRALKQMGPVKSPGPDESQSAFVSNRLVTDNILVSFEVNHYLKNKRGGKECFAALKLDMSKAYDRVEWSFLKAMLDKLGFDKRFVSLVFQCISTVSFSFVLKGEQFGRIIPKRGLRQGDPLSPYLFILCAEALSRLIHAKENQGLIKGVKISRKAPRINTEKSTTVFNKNTPATLRTELADYFNIRVEAAHVKYLGLPTVLGRSKGEQFQQICEKLWHRSLDGRSGSCNKQARLFL
ncbi:UNVERIFIED_CONTAM: putative mitochondrial protein [Sesamum calycinum]|uniref:Mitochondrial protein n=1 Tax=Sesamum calycinum TaxID=2727403 RepID=A0AAW2KE73_9LAMI